MFLIQFIVAECYIFAALEEEQQAKFVDPSTFDEEDKEIITEYTQRKRKEEDEADAAIEADEEGWQTVVKKLVIL